MPHTATAAQILDREFLTIRGKLLEVAAALDRIARGKGPAAGGKGAALADPRLEQIRETLAMLGQDGADRAEKLQLIFSLPYEPGWRKG